MFSKIWSWLDGKKRIIGTLLLGASDLVPDPWLKWGLYGAGMLLGGVGAVHGVIKNKKAKEV